MKKVGKKRLLIVWVSSLAFVTAAGLVTQRAVTPTWKTATQAEIDRVIDPSLLVPIKPDPVEQERYQRLHRAFVKIPGAPQSAFVKGGDPVYGAAYLTKNQAALREIRSILNEGPLQHPIGADTATSFPVFSESKGFVKSIRAAAQGLAAAGRDAEAVDLVALGEAFVLADAKAANTLIDYLVCVAESAIVDAAASDLVDSRKLSVSSLRTLLRVYRDPKDEAGDIKRALRLEFVTQTYPLFRDPVKAFQDRIPKEFRSKQPANQPPPPGSYDAVVTARRASELMLAKLGNLDLPVNRVDTTLEVAFDKEVGSLPKDPSDGEKEPTKTEEWRYRAAMARIPNSFGLSILQFVGLGSESLVRVRSKAESIRNLVRTQIALSLFERTEGHLPDVLGRIVSADYFSNVPTDGYTLKELSYDPTRRLVWSVGDNLTDDNGKCGKLKGVLEPDIVYSIPNP